MQDSFSLDVRGSVCILLTFDISAAVGLVTYTCVVRYVESSYGVHVIVLLCDIKVSMYIVHVASALKPRLLGLQFVIVK